MSTHHSQSSYHSYLDTFLHVSSRLCVELTGYRYSNAYLATSNSVGRMPRECCKCIIAYITVW